MSTSIIQLCARHSSVFFSLAFDWVFRLNTASPYPMSILVVLWQFSIPLVNKPKWPFNDYYLIPLFLFRMWTWRYWLVFHYLPVAVNISSLIWNKMEANNHISSRISWYCCTLFNSWCLSVFSHNKLKSYILFSSTAHWEPTNYFDMFPFNSANQVLSKSIDIPSI